MTTAEILKQIEERAERYGSFRTTERFKKIKVNSFIAGSKEAHNNALDIARDLLIGFEAGLLNEEYEGKTFFEILESIKL